MIKEEDKTLFMLIADVHRQFGHKIREIEKKNGYSTCASCILIELHKNGSLTQVELVEKIYMRPSSVSVALQKLETDGLITRTSKDDDLRYTLVNLTQLGKQYCEKMKLRIKNLDEKMTEKINDDDLVKLKNTLIKLSAELKEEFNEDF